ncbi:hypothetical protein ZOSMA_206G00210 [Zostera marina]|uniref:NPH3 domain-containing protein n=1 Tax=Zostera marina TaxID=29655 RepID=A0A0K9PNK7_ZOSMR|nr:hypothetical protein ZOSMA_206G00210 [Zostera marina]
MLLRAAIYLETTIACRLDLEKMISFRLDQATLDDLLIPSFSIADDTLLDVDTVQRILVSFLESQIDDDSVDDMEEEECKKKNKKESKVGKLMEFYLAEISTDLNLSVSKFVGFAELIPEEARTTEDGMYRAIDIYLKAHPSLNDVEKKKISSAMDCQRLSLKACTQAAHNQRLPVQTMVQVLYYEQHLLLLLEEELQQEQEHEQIRNWQMKISYEFDFLREADAMKRIRKFVYAANKKPPVLIPREISGLTTRRVLVMDFIEGIPILNLEIEMVMCGLKPLILMGRYQMLQRSNSLRAQDCSLFDFNINILKNLTNAYGQMILKSGFFHADPHPGNILICKNSEVALLDYGQVKHLPEYLRLGYANLVLAMADNDPLRAVQSYKDLGIETSSTCADESKELLQLARSMFDTKLPPGVTILSPFAEDSSLQKVSVPSFPEELFSVLRTMQLLRGLSVGMGVNYSCAEQWRPIAEETLHKAGKLKDFELRSRKQGVLRKKLER